MTCIAFGADAAPSKVAPPAAFDNAQGLGAWQTALAA
jgi:hypothetical protein